MLPQNENDFKYYIYIIFTTAITCFIAIAILALYSYFFLQANLFHLQEVLELIKYFGFLLLHNRFNVITTYILYTTATLFMIVFYVLYNKNPYTKTLRFSRFATFLDVKKMQPQVLKQDGYCLGSFKGTMLKTNEPLGVLCVAPAGAGKTSGTVIPTILSCNKDSLVINDPKGELYDSTFKYRENLGSVFRIEWGQKMEEWNNKTTCWNPLDLENLPNNSIDRSKYIDMITNILIKKSSGDTFWSNSGRKTLSAMMLFCIYSKELNTASSHIAEVKDKLATIGVVEEDEDCGEKDPSQYGFIKLANLCKAFKENSNIPHEILDRCYNVFSELGSTSPNTLGSILATISSDLAVFNNESVRQITSKNNFSLQNIRAINNKPITVYLISPASEQELFGVLSGIFVETAYKYITSEKLDIVKKSNIVRFILDEVAFFPSISAIIDGPAIARGYKGSFLFVCQDLGQIKEKYGENGLNTMMTNTAFKIILPQNNDSTAKRLASLSGQTEIAEWVNVGGKMQKQKKIVNLIESTDVMSLPSGKQIIIVQNNAKTPIMCNIPFYFKDKTMLKQLRKLQ